jgi:uncharacterized iron-regulated protein
VIDPLVRAVTLIVGIGLVLCGFAACSVTHQTPSAPPPAKAVSAASRAAPAPEPEAGHTYAFPAKVGEILDLAQGRPIEPRELSARLAHARLVFVGESHDEPSSRRFQIQVIDALLAQDRDVFVALEMFPPAANEVLAEWSRGNLSEKEFLARSGWYESWGFPWVSYRDLFLELRDKRLPMRGINVTREQRKLGGEGTLDPALREEVGELDLNVEPHRRYLSDALADSGHPDNPSFDSPEFLRFLRIQVLWDHVMGVRAAKLVQAGSSRAVVVVLIGSGHLEYKLGANLRAARARPDLPQITLLDRFILPEETGPEGRTTVPVGLADFVRVERQTELGAKPGSLSQLRLSAAQGGVKVDSVRAFPEGAVEGFKADDLIQSLNSKAYSDPIELRMAYETIPPHGSADWAILREGKAIHLKTSIHPKN